MITALKRAVGSDLISMRHDKGEFGPRPTDGYGSRVDQEDAVSNTAVHNQDSSASDQDDSAPSLTLAQRNIIFGTIMLGMLLSALDQTVVSTALPTIVGDLGGGGHMSWVVTAYLLAQTISTVLAGRFGDLFGRKRVFQISVAIFIIGSFFCGLATNMTLLIGMRAIQGIGGGGITVTATALIADIIPLRDRGKYQGALGAVFGVTTVAGPLLGGYFTDSLSWRWVFYINVPIAIAVIILAARTIPGAGSRSRPKIDYLGVLFVALGAAGLTLAVSWGGTEYAWTSLTLIGLFAASIASLVIFVLVERRAAEPILPMRLFSKPVFSIASLLSFIVGFAMLGALTFLPSYLQYVGGASATMSGVRTLPMVVGLLTTSLLSGTVVGRSGRYKPFPIVGCAVIAVGLFLLSTMDEDTSIVLQSLYMLILGAGIGMVMQLLTLVVQNTSDYRDLGSATSGVTFFRTLGSSFGASIMGTFYASRTSDLLPAAIQQAGVSPSDLTNPTAVHALAAGPQAIIVHAYAQSLHTVFLYAVPVALLGLVVAIFLPQVAMRGTALDTASSPAQGFAMPSSADADRQLEAVVGRVLRNHHRSAGEVLARSGAGVDLATGWGLLGIHLRARILGEVTGQRDIEQQIGIPPGVLTSFYDDLADAGYLRRDGSLLTLTDSGETVVHLIGVAWRDWLLEEVSDWLPPELTQADDGSTLEQRPDISDAEFRAKVRASVNKIARRAMIEQHQETTRRRTEVEDREPAVVGA